MTTTNETTEALNEANERLSSITNRLAILGDGGQSLASFLRQEQETLREMSIGTAWMGRSFPRLEAQKAALAAYMGCH
jgi:hypothetical protein